MNSRTWYIVIAVVVILILVYFFVPFGNRTDTTATAPATTTAPATPGAPATTPPATGTTK